MGQGACTERVLRTCAGNKRCSLCVRVRVKMHVYGACFAHVHWKQACVCTCACVCMCTCENACVGVIFLCCACCRYVCA